MRSQETEGGADHPPPLLSPQGTFSLIIEAWNAESPTEYTGRFLPVSPSRVRGTAFALERMNSFLDRQPKQPGEPPGHEEEVGHRRGLVPGRALRRAERAALLLPRLLRRVLLRRRLR